MPYDHSGQSEGAQRAWQKFSRVSDQAQQPAKIQPVGPGGDGDLVAGDETEGGANAMDGWTMGGVFAQIKTDLFLDAAAERDDDVAGPT